MFMMPRPETETNDDSSQEPQDSAHHHNCFGPVFHSKRRSRCSIRHEYLDISNSEKEDSHTDSRFLLLKNGDNKRKIKFSQAAIVD